MNSKDNLNGLILMGGQSSRMGSDKSKLDYHGKPQNEHLFDLVDALVSETYVSTAPNQEVTFTDRVIADQFPTKGPINGILSAMSSDPDKAWLVLAVDLPLVNERTINQLIRERNTSKLATAFATRKTEMPEPLVAIWEPQAFEPLKEHHLVKEHGCPRKFLINSDIQLVFPEDDMELFNANSPDEFKQAKSIIG